MLTQRAWIHETISMSESVGKWKDQNSLEYKCYYNWKKK